jgi:hypothetical protein
LQIILAEVLLPKPTSKQGREAEARRKQEAELGQLFPELSVFLVKIHSIFLGADIQLEYGDQTVEHVTNLHSLSLPRVCRIVPGFLT